MARAKKKRTKQRISGDERREQILEAALDVFAERGFRGARTREIAARARISETLIFQHFDNKQSLYQTAITALFAGHPLTGDKEIESAAAAQDDRALLNALALHMIRHSREDPRIVRLALFQALEGAPQKHKHRPIDAIADYLQHRVKAGALREDLDIRLVAHLFLMTIYMYMVEHQVPMTGAQVTVSDEEAVDTLVRVFLEGIKKD